MPPVLLRTFSALGIANYRRYALGQAVSLSGTWMQRVAQAWLVLELGGSGTDVGLVTALQFLPLLVLGAWGGVVVDRVDKRRLLVATQSASGALALVLGILTATGVVRLWMVMLLAAGLGFAHLLDVPARQSFVFEMVGPDHLTNAVTLNSVTVNAARMLGPALAGVLIATTGLAVCFVLNAASYLVVVAAFARMRSADLHRSVAVVRGPGQLREGLAYVWREQALRAPLLTMAVVGALAYEFQVILPLLARFVFDGGAGTYGAMTACMGLGAVVAGLVIAGRNRSGPRSLVHAAYVFGVLILATALAPTLALAMVALVGVGGASIAFLALGNASLQVAAAPEMRGRVMALWSIAFLGTTPIGGPLVGWVGEHLGPRVGLALGGVATVAAAAVLSRLDLTAGPGDLQPAPAAR
ncbi:MAG: MFS transporter [Actinomycetota bacterium]|nr:MFS transporter [Actinomycetota bacterium]